MPQVPAPAPVHPTSHSTTAAEKKLKALTAALSKQPDNLSAEVRELVKDVNTTASQEETTQAVQAIGELGHAKAYLTAIKWARYQNHGAWKAFLKEAMDQWTTFTTAFQEQEAALTEALQQARQAVKAAKDRSAELQESVQEISDGEGEMEGVEGPEALQEGLVNMQNALQNMYKEAEALHADEKPPKRPRPNPESSGLGAHGGSSKAMQPFGGPGGS